MKEIENIFIEKCEEFAKQHDALFTNYYNEKKTAVFSVTLSLIKIEFCYQKKATTYAPPSTLYARIYLNKNSSVYYLLPDLLSCICANDFRSTCFSLIEAYERMESCFDALASIIEDHFEDILTLAKDDSSVSATLFDTYRKLFKLKDNDIDFSLIDADSFTTGYFRNMQRYRSDFFAGRLTTSSPPFAAILTGNVEKAVAIYEGMEKKNNIFPYEKQLLDYIKTDEGKSFRPAMGECNTVAGLKHPNHDFIDFPICFLVTAVIFSLIFCSLMGIFQIIFSSNAVFFGAPWYMGFLCAGLPALFGALHYRKKIRKLYMKKEEMEKANAVDAIYNSKGTNKLVSVLFVLSLVFGVVFSGLLIADHAVFSDDDFRYMDSQKLFTYHEYSYDDIENVYYIESRHNGFDERIDFPSYVIETSDGRLFDLYGYTSEEKTKKHLVPLLSKKGFTFTTLDSDRDLPKTESER